MKAMILAAGKGTRLLPYTRKRPKPLFPILNKPLLGLTINRLRQAGFAEIVVNVHHLPNQIKKAVANEADIVLQEEEKVLGTGGGLRRALPHFDQGPVLVVNGDIYHTINYRNVYRYHQEIQNDVTLVLHELPRFNSVSIDHAGAITGFGPEVSSAGSGGKLLAFTGIQVINPEILQSIPTDTEICIIEVYRKMVQEGVLIRAYLTADHFWTDMGTPADYLKLHGDLLKHRAPAYDELRETVAEGPFVGLNNLTTDSDIKTLDWVCLGQEVSIGDGATLQRCVVWDEAAVPAQSLTRDTIVMP